MTTVEQLVELQNGEPTTTSLQVAETFGKKHENVLKAIDNIVKGGLVNINETLRNKAMAYFELSSYKNEQNHQRYRMYKMNYKGFTLLAGGFTDKKFMEYKVMFVEQFDHMQHYIQEQQQQQFFAPETVDQQIKREQLAIAKDNSNNAKSREVRSWLKLMKNKPEAVEMAAPKVMSILLDLPEEQLQIEPAHRYIYSAEEIGKRLGVDAYAIGIAAQKLGLKATRKEHQNRWSKNNLVGATSDDQKSRWMYTEEAFKEIKGYLEQ
ncbi:Rha family transcriptional regulator [Weissella paramesenteroides]|uniref:Rha family transcriptional regulator n=1 Tax=Weissella paramesenteroides TaxID=1249 RepID=UPI00123BC923|nr:Rha family transcriptional regulator [Weissella paramesenteroides]KAA8440459.1 Rha family transcriptional regulator [Weissella paramesenteroides]KAA8440950.1 Rha family transcriptional regulator [Weissella paramesenteroides]KAA8443381.1 Rha family transcriptional regulator [Weissella paramesenteroides]KAA8447670.1 Rha family transcriptional regulator [Weissella paramesenteroides]KAA8449727.1 Rha family transcriptional regulator [Weissella paramesenteroides]